MVPRNPEIIAPSGKPLNVPVIASQPPPGHTPSLFMILYVSPAVGVKPPDAAGVRVALPRVTLPVTLSWSCLPGPLPGVVPPISHK